MTLKQISMALGRKPVIHDEPEPRPVDPVEEAVRRAFADYESSQRTRERHPNW